MPAVTFVLSYEMADVSITGLEWFILIPRLNHTGSHRPSDSHSKPIYIEKKIKGLEQESPTCCNPRNYKEGSCLSLLLVTSYDMPQRKAAVLFCTLKNPTGHCYLAKS